MIEMLHDKEGYQVVEQILDLVWERFYWNTMAHHVNSWAMKCKRCYTAKGPCAGLDVKQDSTTANNPLDLLYIDFTKTDPGTNGKCPTNDGCIFQVQCGRKNY